MMRLPERIRQRLRLPLIAAPMFRVSGVDLAREACRAGAIGAFPTINAGSVEQLDAWLTQLDDQLGPTDAPYCPNLIIRKSDLAEDVDVLLRHHVEMVITSVGSPAAVAGPLKEAGVLILADVGSLHHARRAIEAGADGLVLLTAGAGGNTGWLNPFAFVRAVREFFDGIIVLAGGMCDGVALYSAEVLGADLAYMGTKFIATTESMAEPEYKNMVVNSDMDDVMLTRAFTGMDTSMLVPSIEAAGLDPKKLDEDADVAAARAIYGAASVSMGPKRWRDIWSAGHSVSGVQKMLSARDVVDRVLLEYEDAKTT